MTKKIMILSAIVCIALLLLLIAGSLARAQEPRVAEPTPVKGTPIPPGEKPVRERPRRQERAPLPAPQAREGVVTGVPSHDFDVLLWGEDFESGTDDWSWDGLWHPITDTHPSGYGNSYSPVTSFWYGQNDTGNYDTGITNTGFLTLTTPISLPSLLPNAGLSFWSWEETESEGGYFDYDIRSVEVATDTITPQWTTIWSTEDHETIEGAWHLLELDLAPYIGNDILLCFQFDTVDDEWNEYRGWYVDDMAVGYDFAFQPSVVVDKTGDELSKVGDTVTYTFTITNTSSSDSPNLILDSITDTLLGSLVTQANVAGCDVLTFNEACTFDVGREVLDTDADPLTNTVTVHYHPDGFPDNDISHDNDHSVNLFRASIEVEKAGDELSNVGDEVNYTITITNTSSSDSPDLIKDSISDSLLTLSPPAACDSLAPGASCSFGAAYTVLETDPDPLVNTVTVHYHPDGFPDNDVWDDDDHSVQLGVEYYIYLPLILKQY